MAVEQQDKRKIAILGSGMAAMTTALELSSAPNWQDRHEITVYQMGWRLGGKGASGRGECGRIEEHGLHIWMGFYDNAFTAIRQVYKELVDRGLRKPDAPLATWDEAFKEHSLIVLEEQINDHWENWQFDCPTNGYKPGEGVKLNLLDYLKMILEWIFKHHIVCAGYQNVSDIPKHVLENPEQHIGENTLGHWLLQEFEKNQRLTHSLADASGKHPKEFWHGLWSSLDIFSYIRAYLAALAEKHYDDTTWRRRFILFDLGVTFLTGLKSLIEDYMKEKDIKHWWDLTSEMLEELKFDKLDDKDLRQWMREHGAAEITVKSAIINSFYDLVFAFEQGNTNKPNFAAGVALRSMLNIGFGYKGAIFWKMQAGMGDVVFAPIYQVLKARGVKFEFFHKVKQLHLDAKKQRVQSIDIARQVTLKHPDYDPFIDVKGLPCWPSQPRYDQIIDEQARELKQRHIDLEHSYTPEQWRDPGEITLQAGKDFDDVVFGISLGSVPLLCKELLDASEPWRTMVDKVLTVRTQALQLWFNQDLHQLGWQDGSPVMCGYVDPLNTWADMSYLIAREDWPSDQNVQNISYYCGPMTDTVPNEDADERVRQNSLDFCRQAINHLMPKATRAGSTELDWSLLVDLKQQHGPQRLDAQYLRANVEPSERYVLSVAGSTKYRLAPGASGFDNLYLAGDWTLNGFNAGCIEATVMSGMLASNAICGSPPLENIRGLDHP